MFLTLLLVTLVIAVIASVVVMLLFSTPISRILERIVAEDIAFAGTKYLRFAIVVVGVSGGVRIHDLQACVQPATE